MRTIDALLTESPLFLGLSKDDLTMIAGCGSNVQFKAGTYLFHEGDPSDQFYLIRHGTVALEIASPERGRVVISTLSEGDLLGWSWLVPPYRKQSDARAVGLVRATAVDGACIRMKCEADPRLGYELLKRLAQIMEERLAATRLQLLDVYGGRA
jgi:CRP/FNR family transcriptional regulator, cyclic AMP receptor protein